MTGGTYSGDFPTTPAAFDTSYNGGTWDAFVTELNSTGSGLVYSTFLGGNGIENRTYLSPYQPHVNGSIALDALGNIYVTGNTYSSNFPTTPGVVQGTFGGGGDAFVVRFALDTPLSPVLSVSPGSLDFGSIFVGSTQDLSLMVTNSGEGTLTGSCSTIAPFSLQSDCPFSLTAGQSQQATIRFAPTSTGLFVSSIDFTSNGGNTSLSVQGEGQAPPTTGALQVTVRRSDTNAALAGATVSLSGGPSSPAPQTTDSSGSTTFSTLEPGTYTVTASLTGFETSSSAATVSANITTSASLALTPVTGTLPNHTVFQFTNGGATGAYGPAQSQVDTAYTGTTLEGQVTTINGIQYWTVPQTGTYTIEAFGAQGGYSVGGLGARMKGEFSLSAGTVLSILVGQVGLSAPSTGPSYGGGGGTFVVVDTTPLIVAGGGGGGFRVGTTDVPGGPGRVEESGGPDGKGGQNGNGGQTNFCQPYGWQYGGGGAGFYTDGALPVDSTVPGDTAKAFLNGGYGADTLNDGGFGGGGGTTNNGDNIAGGGGGYSGGNGGCAWGDPAGGGGSYNSGLNQDNTPGVNTGQGKVVISSFDIAANTHPIANAGPDQTANEGVLVALDGSGSSDPESAPLTYQWVQLAGPSVALANPVTAQPTFTAPLVGMAGETFTFQLTVNDGIDSATDTVNVLVQNVNHSPTADAGADQTKDEESLVTLNGSASSDPDGDLLVYSWTQLSGPEATLSNPSSPTPSFTAPPVTSEGATLTFQLVVNDGTQTSQPDAVDITIKNVNHPPVADAGLDQTVHVGVSAALDGSGSADSDGNTPLSFAWNIIGKPQGSTAALPDTTASMPSLTPDVIGDYTIQLVVTDSLGAASAPDTVVISTTNSAPVADAGADQLVISRGTVVQLNGTQSFDDNGDTLTYQWSFVSKPERSNTALSAANTAMPSFIADVYGQYVIQLVVRDSWSSSAPDTIVVTFGNVRPVAHAGTGGSIIVGDTAVLNGSLSSDENQDPLAYQWSLTSIPEGSSSAIINPTTTVTTFTPDTPGTYVIQLVVSDGALTSDPAAIQIQVIALSTAAIEAAQETQEQISTLPPDPAIFKNTNMQNSLINKINAAIASIEAGNYQDALGQLQNDILKKTDGCAESGSPDKNDWIADCPSQNQVYPYVIRLIDFVQRLL